jgi:hypothetical protein
VVVALIGLMGSIAEMINTGGTVHGLVAWPGAASISLTVVVLIASITALAIAYMIAAGWWRRTTRAA